MRGLGVGSFALSPPLALLLASWLALPLTLAGCDDIPDPEDAGVAARIHPAFEPAPDPMDFGAIPFPDDLYLDDDGRVALGALPGQDAASPPAFPDTMRVALADLDGFSPNAPVFFAFPPHSLDPASLPATVAASAREDSAVFLVDADPASPQAFTRRPVQIHWHASRGRLALRPADGHPLVPGRRYAAVVTTLVRDDRGAEIGPAPLFREVRDASARPDDPVLGEAHDRYSGVLASLSANGVPRSRVAALAVFTVQTVLPDMQSARARVWEGDAPTVELTAAYAAGPELDAILGTPSVAVPGLDVEGGVVHAHIGHLVHGTFPARWFASPRPRVHGRFEYDADGEVVSAATDTVPFTLTIPNATSGPAPLVIFCHGIGSERSSMLAIADALAASGYATLGIDLPFHGMRASFDVVDARSVYSGAPTPDGFGDHVGNAIYLDYLGVQDTDGPFEPFHPTYVRDILRQSALELMTAVRAAREGDWSAVQAVPGLESFAVDPAPIAFVGVSLGGIVGTVFVASEPEIGAAVLNVTGGNLGHLVERSAGFAPIFLPILLPRLGVDPDTVDPMAYPASFHPELALYQTLLDRGDSMSFAPLLRRQPRDVLFQMARDDETVPNSATEGLARAAGATILDGEPSFTDLPQGATPLGPNLDVDSSLFARSLFAFSPATHGLLTQRAGTRNVVAPPEPPFERIAPVPVDNPVDEAVAQLVHFLDSWRGGAAEVIAP